LSVTYQEVLRPWAWEHQEPRDMATVLDISANAGRGSGRRRPRPDSPTCSADRIRR